MPHSWFCIEQLDPSAGHGAPASFVSPPSPWQFAETTGGPHVGYHFKSPLPPELDELLPDPDELPPEPEELPPELEELPPELDDPAHVPVTTWSHPSPHVNDDAHPSRGLWQAKPAPPSGYLHACMLQFGGQHDEPPELDELPPELEEPAPDEAPELDDE